MVELKRCPFCGGEAEMWDDGYMRPVIDEGGAYVDMDIKSPDIYGVECTNPECFCQLIGFDSEAEAIAAWNNRASSDNQALELEDRLRQLSLEHVGTMTENAELKAANKEMHNALEKINKTFKDRYLRQRLNRDTCGGAFFTYGDMKEVSHVLQNNETLRRERGEAE